MNTTEPLISGHFYHIYNHGVCDRNLFEKPDNYAYFLNLYDKNLSVFVDTYAWVLMPNHFHILIKVKDSIPECCMNSESDSTISKQFSKLFNSYAQAFNKFHNIRGSLFERPFKRKRIDTEEYLIRIILYIHNNPVHHNFCKHPADYTWSSYKTCISGKKTKLHREGVLSIFDSIDNFLMLHNTNSESDEMDKWLGL